MGLFKKKNAPSVSSPFPAEQYEPVIRSSICTGEKTACFRNRETGKVHEVLVIRGSGDLKEFGAQYGVDVSNLQTIY